MKTFIKTLIILIVFAGSMVALMVIKGNAMSGKRIHKMVFIETKADWLKCQLKDATIIDSTNSVSFNLHLENPQLVTFSIDVGFPFSRLILSWNCDKPESLAALNFEVEVSPDNKNWTKFEYLMFGALDSANWKNLEFPPTEIEGVGKVDTDNLNLLKPMRYARVIVQAIGSMSSPAIMLRRLSLSFSADNSSWEDYAKFQNHIKTMTIGKIKLSVPYFTQWNLPSNLSGNCCSPTSVSMVLNYHGKTIDPETCAHRGYDSEHQMYGNWPFNVEGAYLGGLGKTWVEVHSGFDEIYDEVASGKPVIISIAYGYNKLPNSPVHEETEGHLIVVVGFDGPNIVICNDPAGHGVEDGIVSYPRKELESVWVSHGGVAYHLWPE
jgi:uncharacterized protein YvpB